MVEKPLHVLITAGPTHEPIDAVRFIGNRSSGAMGRALALAALKAGCQVTVLLGPVGPDPAWELSCEGLGIERYRSTAQLRDLLQHHFPACDLLLMAAAVADYTVAAPVAGKLPRQRAGEPLTLTLTPTADLVAEVARQRRADQRVVAFALEEPAMLIERATQKLIAKQVDAIVANPLGTMEAAEIQAVLMTRDGAHTAAPRMSKEDFAYWLLGKLGVAASA